MPGYYPKKIAVIDLGSNSSKALISYVDQYGVVIPDDEKSFPCRLISSTNDDLNIISRENISSLLEVFGALLKFCNNASPDHLLIVATEAIRRSSNALEIISLIEKTYSSNLFILSGEQEAKFVSKGLKCDPRIKGLSSIQAFDLGGGSLELIECRESSPVVAQSLQLGALNVAKKYLANKDFAVCKESEKKVRFLLREQFSNCGLSDSSEFNLIGLGGAVYFLRKIICERKGVVGIDECNEFTLEEVAAIGNEICRLDLKNRLLSFPELPTDRADVFPVVCIIIEELMRSLNKKSFLHSFYNLRYGIASWCGTSNDPSNFPN